MWSTERISVSKPRASMSCLERTIMQLYLAKVCSYTVDNLKMGPIVMSCLTLISSTMTGATFPSSKTLSHLPKEHVHQWWASRRGHSRRWPGSLILSWMESTSSEDETPKVSYRPNWDSLSRFAHRARLYRSNGRRSSSKGVHRVDEQVIRCHSCLLISL